MSTTTQPPGPTCECGACQLKRLQEERDFMQRLSDYYLTHVVTTNAVDHQIDKLRALERLKRG